MTPDAGTHARPTALVTGASRGIGRSIARRLSADHDIIAVARSEQELDSLAEEIAEQGGSCHSLVLDLRDPVAIADALEGVDCDVLVNNAGIGWLKPFLETTAEEWHAMVDVNFNALYHVTRALLPGMMERERGDIVVIGSLAGRNTFAGGSCYSATKHAVIGFAESLMMEVREKGVRVSVVMPGSVATDFGGHPGDPEWMLLGEHVAEAVHHVISAPRQAHLSRIEMRPSMPKKRR